MGAKAHETRIYEIDSNYISDELKSSRFTSELRLAFKSENPESWGVWYRFHHGMTFWSYGEKITVSLTPLGTHSTKVDILSECGMPTQVVDYGKNARNATAIFKHLEKYLPERVGYTITPDTIISSGTPVAKKEPTATASSGFKPAEEVSPTANVNLDKVICPACGASEKITSLFCTRCGHNMNAPKSKFCSRCGASANEESVFCSRCGNKL